LVIITNTVEKSGVAASELP